MLRSIQDILGDAPEASDGRIGDVSDALFDDRYWKLRYIVADTGTWFHGEKTGKVNLLRKQIEKASKFDPSGPVNQDAHQYLNDYCRSPRYQESLTE